MPPPEQSAYMAPLYEAIRRRAPLHFTDPRAANLDRAIANCAGTFLTEHERVVAELVQVRAELAVVQGERERERLERAAAREAERFATPTLGEFLLSLIGRVRRAP